MDITRFSVQNKRNYAVALVHTADGRCWKCRAAHYSASGRTARESAWQWIGRTQGQYPEGLYLWDGEPDERQCLVGDTALFLGTAIIEVSPWTEDGDE